MHCHVPLLLPLPLPPPALHPHLRAAAVAPLAACTCTPVAVRTATSVAPPPLVLLAVWAPTATFTCASCRCAPHLRAPSPTPAAAAPPAARAAAHATTVLVTTRTCRYRHARDLPHLLLAGASSRLPVRPAARHTATRTATRLHTLLRTPTTCSTGAAPLVCAATRPHARCKHMGQPRPTRSLAIPHPRLHAGSCPRSPCTHPTAGRGRSPAYARPLFFQPLVLAARTHKCGNISAPWQEADAEPRTYKTDKKNKREWCTHSSTLARVWSHSPCPLARTRHVPPPAARMRNSNLPDSAALNESGRTDRRGRSEGTGVREGGSCAQRHAAAALDTLGAVGKEGREGAVPRHTTYQREQPGLQSPKTTWGTVANMREREREPDDARLMLKLAT
ncbi:hypothetical protein DENSPDRAFT_852550 [Dentipellis sp. KUC8613]|nr:hypothetical protein DENSPDRAFT_852550 [Dentipellis sp. KUC8613]